MLFSLLFVFVRILHGKRVFGLREHRLVEIFYETGVSGQLFDDLLLKLWSASEDAAVAHPSRALHI
jgi:hypothetical protein